MSGNKVSRAHFLLFVLYMDQSKLQIVENFEMQKYGNPILSSNYTNSIDSKGTTEIISDRQ